MTKLCPRGKAAAKRKFAVYPSAYANAYASKICAGKIKDPSGVKRKDFRGPKPAYTGSFIDLEVDGKKVPIKWASIVTSLSPSLFKKKKFNDRDSSSNCLRSSILNSKIAYFQIT